MSNDKWAEGEKQHAERLRRQIDRNTLIEVITRYERDGLDKYSFDGGETWVTKAEWLQKKTELENERSTKAQASPDPVDSPSDHHHHIVNGHCAFAGCDYPKPPDDPDTLLNEILFSILKRGMRNKMPKADDELNIEQAKAQLTAWKDQAVLKAKQEANDEFLKQLNKPESGGTHEKAL